MSARVVLVIGNKNYSSWSLRPWILMRHAGVDFEELRLPLDTPEFQREIGRVSPSRKVPVLHDGELVVWDSLAICEYANERWMDGAGWPVDPALRALARSAAAEMHSGFAALRAQLPMNCRRRPDGYRWNADAQADIDRVVQLWTMLLERSGGPWLGGAALGIVDAMYAPVAIRFRGYGVDVPGAAGGWMRAILDHPAMRAWCEAAEGEREALAKYESLGGAA